MRARHLAEPFPLLLPDSDAHPYTGLSGPEPVRALMPAYLHPLLARALDEGASDDLGRRLPRRTVRHLCPRPADLDDLTLVHPEATAIEVAAVMARACSPLVAVYDGDQVIGAVTLDRLLGDQLLSDGA